MGCIASKRATNKPPAPRAAREFRSNSEGSLPRIRQWNLSRKLKLRSPISRNSTPPALGKLGHELRDRGVDSERDDENGVITGAKKLRSPKSKSSSSSFSLSFKIGSVKNQVTAENSSASWPGWLFAASPEAVHGWIPLSSDSYEKLEKIGQGTYSSVFKAREKATGKLVALKKVRFDNFQPESVRFMAREITILRKLDHENIMKLNGIITSRLSCSIYLVFDYMEHDLAGLISCPEIKFTEPQIKCFMQQLFTGLDYCHHQGVMHRDIKTSNILINNEGVLKIGDFGLANFISTRYRQPLTSRVVTLWYRPPELLLGSTNYGVYVDLWSVGCVFAELLVEKPILKGKTEVEQLHKIFKLCGSPPADFWIKSKLPRATMFKPQAPYESSLEERFKEFPETSKKLIKTLLSITPQNRGTAASLLASEFFTTKPYACEPSNLPKYPPNKEMDAKTREEARRKRISMAQDSSTSRLPRGGKALGDPSSYSMLGRVPNEPQMNRELAQGNQTNVHVSIDKKVDTTHSTDLSGFALHQRKPEGDGPLTRMTRANSMSGRTGSHGLDPSSVLHADETLDSQPVEFEDSKDYDCKYW
ncbi:hypothetical protein V2J09_017437 [Rumex salicifolius]